MYLLYEHHFDASGAILATDMVLSSGYPGRKFVNFKRDPAEAAIFEFAKRIFKNIHFQNRTYEDVGNVWSFLGTSGKEVYEALKASPIVAVGLKFQRVENLMAQAATGSISAPSTSTWNANDFFYNPQGVVQSTGPTKETIQTKLAFLLDIDAADVLTTDLKDLKKLYRFAAMKYHPDRNNGDSTQMTELNYLWQQYQPYINA